MHSLKYLLYQADDVCSFCLTNLKAGILDHPSSVSKRAELLSCLPRVTVTSCFVNIVIRDL